MKDLYQSADWKKEKHVPVIEVTGTAQKGQPVRVKVSVGREIPHPNTTAHHIVWIELYFRAEGEKFPYLLSRSEFSAHGASVEGPDTSTVYTAPSAESTFFTEKKGMLYAAAYCNIHGLWQGEAEVKGE